MTPESLSAIQKTIVACVAHLPGQLQRSAVAKLLVGSGSTRVAAWRNDPFFGRLSGRTRKDILYELDILLQQGWLMLDARRHVCPGTPPELG